MDERNAEIGVFLGHYFANRDQVDCSIEESEAFADQLRSQTRLLVMKYVVAKRKMC